MLDRFATPLLRTPLQAMARLLVRAGVGANAVTLAGFGVGLVAAILIANGAYAAGAIALLTSRLLDGLDGAVARETQPTDAGGFLDISLDFLFYASIPLAFAVAEPTTNALPAAALLAAFIGTGSSFLAFATLAAKRGMDNLAYPDKSFYFLGGLTEATETLAFFVAMCLWPAHFATLAYLFAALCAVTTATRIWWGWRTFS
ncbi:PgsA Phosphatidylglycerophosphate synthase [Comamonadaceae bacterium]|jgi:phosphatidylglycerophosphate synthase|uniref:CDP-alcohol phosphatidyltransferase family protein n=1 Tax=Rhodoferax potami TaxID=3068338 RepID=A0ABU3KKZ7_9BURK|nr:CDP-alcohol phosphatidyltransferase family protein [Rhodoferax sp. TBRC 17660]MDT7518211.1 CDP-alcohol phosphatidyltransferase family protein [Rhodoferax sp. TBRC 17660]